MHDPFPLPPPTFLVSATQPLAASLSLPTLPLHIHELLLATLSYHLICTYLSPLLSTFLFPSIYPHFPPRTRLNWDVHVVSLLQSLFINAAALWVMWGDEERRSMGWEERVWGYTGAGGMIQGFAAGYFLWDLGICVRNVGVFGWGLLAHAVAALMVFCLGFRPFVNFYGPTFILYELSSPFLNFHWFFDKLHMTGSRPQWYNGILLLSSFFCCRLLWGTYQSVRVYQDVWAAMHRDRSLPTYKSQQRVFEPSAESDEVMRYAGEYVVPMWLAVVYLGSNIVLNTLNFYWFGKMIETIKKRFTEAKGKKGGKEEKEEGVMVEGLIDSSTLITEVVEERQVLGNGVLEEHNHKGNMKTGVIDGRNVVEVESTQIRRRKD
ncbi:hypothetical protein ACLMJK_007601 [Lecanora helva]